MNRELLRSLAKAVGGRVKSYLLQAAKDEAGRLIRHFRAGMQSSPPAAAGLPSSGQSADSAGLLAAGQSAPASSSGAAPSSAAAEPESGAAAAAVPRHQPTPPEAPQSQRPEHGAAAKPAPKRAAKSDEQPLESVVNINSASKDELMSLPGIGEARADAIIKARPFTAASDLVDKKVLPASVAEGLKGRIAIA
jgi:DNA uptake protein ComE-like DNA-binding protein